MNFNQVREKTKWWGLICGAIFLVISSYIRWKFVFESGNAAGMLLLIALIAALRLTSNRLREPSNGSIKKGSHSLSMRKTMTTSETSIFRNSVGKPNLCTAAFEGLHYA
jgi:hypothetical protein